jgi:hypothetical protein
MGFPLFAILAAAVSGVSVPPSSESENSSLAASVTENPAPKQNRAPKSFESFTGKVTCSRLRVRLQPTLEGIILEEFNQGDMVVATDEVDEFYAIKPDPARKGYIYRAYVLDNVVEANNVNVRLGPDTHTPILCQMSQGDHITGTVCPENNKWLVVDLPETIRFYVAKDYIVNIGDPGLFKRTQARKQQVATRLDVVDRGIQEELAKSFDDIQLVSYVNELKTIVAQNQDLVELASRAQALLKSTQEQYLQLSLGRTSTAAKNGQPSTVTTDSKAIAMVTPDLPRRLVSASLEQQEEGFIEQALRSGKVANKQDFYVEALKNAQEIEGQLVPYDRPVKNRPGDFMLVDGKTKVPVAYLYSCSIDLHSLAGQIVHLAVAPRPNHHFALPAYVVLDVQR